MEITFRETPWFSEDIISLLEGEEYRALQSFLATSPDAGDLIPGGEGLRKIRWSAKGHGKRGGIRSIYYWFVDEHVIFFLDVYAKNEKSDLTRVQRKELATLIREERSR